jgi:hypothetical protein
MGKKLISKNHLTPAPPHFLLKFCLKSNKNQGTILEKFESGARPGTWSNRLLKFRCKSIIKECKNEVKNDNFKIFFIYTLCVGLFILKTKIEV